jgi:hypothetical protein
MTKKKCIIIQRASWLKMNYYVTKKRGMGLNDFILKKLNRNIKKRKNPESRFGFAC